MTIAEALLAEFEHESQTTRKFLERVPEDKLDWQPHEKSMTAGQLALHIAETPGQVIGLAAVDSAPAPDFGKAHAQPSSREEILNKLDESIAVVRNALPGMDDASMQSIWRVFLGEKELLSMPRVMLLRSIMLNHWYHHRGQLGVYLRLLGAKVPSSYGPSADERPSFLDGVEMEARRAP